MNQLYRYLSVVLCATSALSEATPQKCFGVLSSSCGTISGEKNIAKQIEPIFVDYHHNQFRAVYTALSVFSFSVDWDGSLAKGVWVKGYASVYENDNENEDGATLSRVCACGTGYGYRLKVMG